MLHVCLLLYREEKGVKKVNRYEGKHRKGREMKRGHRRGRKGEGGWVDRRWGYKRGKEKMEMNGETGRETERRLKEREGRHE